MGAESGILQQYLGAIEGAHPYRYTFSTKNPLFHHILDFSLWKTCEKC